MVLQLVFASAQVKSSCLSLNANAFQEEANPCKMHPLYSSAAPLIYFIAGEKAQYITGISRQSDAFLVEGRRSEFYCETHGMGQVANVVAICHALHFLPLGSIRRI